MKRIIITLVLLVGVTVLAEASLYRSYQTEDGLSHNSVWAVMQDSRGFMWFGTNDGLNRFDGLKFKVFRREEGDTLSLGNNFIHTLLEAPDGDIYVGTKEGLYRHNPGTEKFAHISLDGKSYGHDRNSVHQLLFDDKGMLWVGCYGQGIFCVDTDGGKVRHYTEPELPSRFVTSMTADMQGDIWVGTDNCGVFRFCTKTGKTYPTALPKTNIQTIYRQNNNTLWVGTSSDGLYHYDPRSDSYKCVSFESSTEPMHDIKAITPYGSTSLIMGSEDGLLKLDCVSETVEHFDSFADYDNLPDKSIFSITVDNEGAIWLGTYFYGVSYWAPRINSFTFHPVTSNSTSSANIIRQFASAPDGNIIITSRNNGISLYSPESHTIRDMKVAGLSDNVQFAILMDNQLWISDYDRGLVVVSYPSGAIRNTYTTADGLPSNVLNCAYRTSRGHIYAGTARGAARLDGARFTAIPEVKNASVMTILEDYNGNVWFATHFHGLFKKTPEGVFTNYTTAGGALPGNNINNIFLDSHGLLWVGTEGEGLAIFNPATGKTEKRFSEHNGLPSNIIYSTQEDLDGNIWITTGGGLVKISGDSHEINNFKYIENLLKIHYTHNSSLRADKCNKLFFGGSSGFVTFDPSEISINTAAPVVRVIDFTVNGKVRRMPAEKLELESNEATFGLDVACLSYLSPEQNVVSYRLEGFDREWKTLSGTDRHIEYMNLPWGDYSLQIRGANNDGVWSEPLKMKVQVNRPLLMSNAMLIVYALLLISGIWLAKRRLEYLQRRKMVKFSHAKEKELYEAKIGFFTNIAHEIRTPLSLISAPLESILASGDGSPRTRHNLEVMRSNVHRLLELINQLLDFRKVEAQLMMMYFSPCNVSGVVKEICARYEEFAILNKIKIDYSGVAPDITCTLDAEAFEKIVGNLMSNATKFAHRHIKVVLTVEDSELHLAVSDDGPGIKEKDISRIFESFYQVDDHGKHPGTGLGLPLARRLAEMHKGSITVESEYGKGCRFLLSIPTTLEAGEPKADEDAGADADTATDDATADIDDIDDTKARQATLLIVEDNEQLRSFIAENLGETYNIVTAGNGIEATRVLEKKSVDLIVSDIMMPDMDGIELCRVVRSNAVTAHLPIVLLSAKTDVETKVEGLNIGADAYIEKPFSIEQLRAQIKSILDARSRLQKNFIKSPLDYYKQQHTDDFHESENAEFVNRLNDTIIENLTNAEFNIDTVARQFAMSRSSFHSKVKAITGETPNNYIRVVRLCKAAELLAEGRYQIVEVCYMVGFNTPSYFSKCFAEYFGKLPKDYISEINNNNTK